MEKETAPAPTVSQLLSAIGGRLFDDNRTWEHNTLAPGWTVACPESRRWLASLPSTMTLRQAWELCVTGDWLVWLLESVWPEHPLFVGWSHHEESDRVWYLAERLARDRGTLAAECRADEIVALWEARKIRRIVAWEDIEPRIAAMLPQG